MGGGWGGVARSGSLSLLSTGGRLLHTDTQLELMTKIMVTIVTMIITIIIIILIIILEITTINMKINR